MAAQDEKQSECTRQLILSRHQRLLPVTIQQLRSATMTDDEASLIIDGGIVNRVILQGYAASLNTPDSTKNVVYLGIKDSTGRITCTWWNPSMSVYQEIHAA